MSRAPSAELRGAVPPVFSSFYFASGFFSSVFGASAFAAAEAGFTSAALGMGAGAGVGQEWEQGLEWGQEQEVRRLRW